MIRFEGKGQQRQYKNASCAKPVSNSQLIRVRKVTLNNKSFKQTYPDLLSVGILSRSMSQDS